MPQSSLVLQSLVPGFSAGLPGSAPILPALLGTGFPNLKDTRVAAPTPSSALAQAAQQGPPILVQSDRAVCPLGHSPVAEWSAHGCGGRPGLSRSDPELQGPGHHAMTLNFISTPGK